MEEITESLESVTQWLDTERQLSKELSAVQSFNPVAWFFNLSDKEVEALLLTRRLASAKAIQQFESMPVSTALAVRGPKKNEEETGMPLEIFLQKAPPSPKKNTKSDLIKTHLVEYILSSEDGYRYRKDIVKYLSQKIEVQYSEQLIEVVSRKIGIIKEYGYWRLPAKYYVINESEPESEDKE